MTLPAPTYDLMLLLDPQAEEATRAKIVADARGAIEAQGEFLRHDDWGDRTLAYPIDRRTDAEYHLLQFHAGAPELLHTLDRALRITDGILRFRIIKLKPGVPEAPDVRGAQAMVEQTAVEPEVAVAAPAAAAEQAEMATEPLVDGALAAEAALAVEATLVAEDTAEAEAEQLETAPEQAESDGEPGERP